ncbi:MAG TPA: 2-oxo acid dehydrogenase subunit E2, partial [Bryobacteraceae bacterium]
MSQSSPPDFGINSWLEDELYQQYLHDRKTVDESWKKVFESNGTTPVAPLHLPAMTPQVQPAAGEQLVPLRGAAARIAENMNASLSIPLATSQRVIPVKVIDENRRIINEHRVLVGKTKISYTHIVGWAIVKAVQSNPALNHA